MERIERVISGNENIVATEKSLIRRYSIFFVALDDKSVIEF